MRILHLLNSDRFSGAENVVCQIINMFKKTSGIEMAYCSRDGQIKEALSERNINFYPVSKINVSEIRRVIKTYHPDIIHAHDMRAGFFAALSSHKIPLISHIHNNAFDSRGLSPKSIAYLYAALKAKHIFWVSKSAFDGYCFNNFCTDKSTVLCNIIDEEDLKQKMMTDNNNYDYDVVFLGRLAFPKNPHRLIEISSEIVKMRPETKMAVIGTGELESEIKQLAEDMKLLDNIYFLGFQNNPYKILHDAKVMLMTSRWEGTPMCALEAMALGVPIVSTPTDGLKDLICSGENGFLSNNDAELAQAVIDILSSDEVKKKYSAKSLESSLKRNDKNFYKSKLTEVYNTSVCG